VRTLPAVSVVFPVFNAASSLPLAINALVGQSLTSWECLAVDDGSTDDSPHILARWADQDPRVRLIARPHSGIVAALNAGVAAAAAPLIARFDADDTCAPSRLERQLGFLAAHPEIDVIACQVAYQSSFGPQGGFAEYVRWTNSLLSPREHALNRFVDAPVVHPTIVARRALFETYGSYRADPAWPEDFELWLRWMQAGAAFAKLPAQLYTWTDRPDRLSRCDARYDQARFYECKAAYLASGPLAGHSDVAVWGAGRLTRQRAEMLSRHGLSIRFYVDIDPRRIGRSIHGRPVIDRAQLAAQPDLPLVAYVASRGARDQIRRWLSGTRYVEGQNFWCAA
jgi:glycosyltransferase involved in cell wall biosynthesis